MLHSLPTHTHIHSTHDAMAAPIMAFRNKDEALEELVTSEERYVQGLKTFRNVSGRARC